MTSSWPAAKTPIFLMSFNRPKYLAQVVNSIRAQVECDVENRPIFLFQDGAVNPFSNTRHAADEDIEQCIAIFTDAIPNGKVMASPINLGVALNFDRAERCGFEDLGAEAAIFLEDDLVLGKHYIATLDKLIREFSSDSRVGYLAAYGDHTRTLEQQRANSRKLICLTHNWGFALFRRQWLKMRGRVVEYLDLMKNSDYRYRNGDKIRSLFESWGYGCPAISQDAAKTIACCIDGVIKLNTYVCHATYIGELGLHMNQRLFAERGYARTTLFPEMVSEFEPLTNDLYRALLAEQRNWAGKPGNRASADTSAGQVRIPPIKQMPSASPAASPADSVGAASANSSAGGTGLDDDSAQKLVTDLVAAGYRAVLKREPDSNGLATYSRLFRGRSLPEAVQRMIEGLLKSKEFTDAFLRKQPQDRNWQGTDITASQLVSTERY